MSAVPASLRFYRPFLPMFGGMLLYDNFTLFVRCFLYSFTALTIWLTLLTGIPDREDSVDFHTLLGERLAQRVAVPLAAQFRQNRQNQAPAPQLKPQVLQDFVVSRRSYRVLHSVCHILYVKQYRFVNKLFEVRLLNR